MVGCRPLKAEEVESLCNALSLRDRCILLIGIRCGFRISEILSLKVGAVLNDDGSFKESIKVDKGNVKGKKSSRTMPMHSDLVRVLPEHIKSLRRSELGDFLFQGMVSGGSMVPPSIHRATFHRALKLGMKASGVSEERASSHSMRKTFAAKAYTALGKDIKALQYAMGHNWVSTTGRYLEVDEATVFDAIKGIK